MMLTLKKKQFYWRQLGLPKSFWPFMVSWNNPHITGSKVLSPTLGPQWYPWKNEGNLIPRNMVYNFITPKNQGHTWVPHGIPRLHKVALCGSTTARPRVDLNRVDLYLGGSSQDLYPWEPKTFIFLEVFMVNNMVCRWRKPLFFHGFGGLMGS